MHNSIKVTADKGIDESTGPCTIAHVKVPYPFIARNDLSLLLILLDSGYGAASGYASPEEIPSSSYAYAGARRLLEAGSAWPWTGILNRL